MTRSHKALSAALAILALGCSSSVRSWTKRPEVHSVGPSDPRWGQGQVLAIRSGETAAFLISPPQPKSYAGT